MVANPGEAESVQVGTTPKLEGARKKRPIDGAAKTTEPMAKGFVCPLPPSEASVEKQMQRAVALTKTARTKTVTEDKQRKSNTAKSSESRNHPKLVIESFVGFA
jgi:hypothetical protein